LIQLLAYFGNIVGRNPHYRVEGDYHRAKHLRGACRRHFKGPQRNIGRPRSFYRESRR
jgi:hypothetical protein